MRWLPFVSIALFVVAGCGLTAPDDAPFLTGLGFDKPVAFQWQPSSFTDTNFNRGNDSTALAAFLVKEGALTIQPDTKSPWWHFATADGQDPQGIVTFNLGSRQIDSRGEVKQWQEGSTDNFAETVTYHVQLADGFQKAGISFAQPFGVRVMAVNDPSVGHWQLASAPDALNDAQTIQSALTETGRNYVEEMKGSANRVVSGVFDKIENDLKVGGVIARTAQDPHVLISKRAGVYIYAGRISITGRTIDDLEGICGALQTKIGGPWHAATYQDLLNTLLSQPGSSEWTLNDTPDHRLLGELIGVQNGPINFEPKDLDLTSTPPNVRIVQLSYGSSLNGNGYFIFSGQRPPNFGDSDRLVCVSRIG